MNKAERYRLYAALIRNGLGEADDQLTAIQLGLSVTVEPDSLALIHARLDADDFQGALDVVRVLVHQDLDRALGR